MHLGSDVIAITKSRIVKYKFPVNVIDLTGWNKLHFASAQTFMYTKMFAVHDRAHKIRVLM